MEKNPQNCSVRLIDDGIDQGYIHEGYSLGKRSRPEPQETIEDKPDAVPDAVPEVQEPPKKRQKNEMDTSSIADLAQNFVHSSEEKNVLASLISNIARMEQQLQGLKEQAIAAIEKCGGGPLIQQNKPQSNEPK